MIHICDSVITVDECQRLIEYYNQSTIQTKAGYNHLYKTIVPHTSRKPVDDFTKSIILKIIDKLPNKDVMVEWGHIEKRDIGQYHSPHVDITASWTVLTSVTYLNDDYDGGLTFIDNKKYIVTPKVGRTVWFDGNNLLHEVTTVRDKPRFTLPLWYMAKPMDLPENLIWWK